MWLAQAVRLELTVPCPQQERLVRLATLLLVAQVVVVVEQLSQQQLLDRQVVRVDKAAVLVVVADAE